MMQAETPCVSVVIPNWNGETLLPIVLGSLRQQTYRNFEVLIVDNGSTDTSLALLEREYPEVRVIALDTNRGFSAAVNAGIHVGSGKYVALLNNDVELDPGWLGALAEALDADPRAGFAASRIRFFGARERLDSAGDQIRMVPENRGRGALDGPEFDDPVRVPSACAAAALYRRSMLDEIGLFNEDLFAYFEDAELGMRAQIAGYPCLYVPRAIAYHMGSETSRRISQRAAFLQVRNVIEVYLTTLPREYALRHLPRVLVSRLWFALREAGVVVAANVMFSLLHRLPRTIRRRREIFALRRVSDAELMRLLLPPPRAGLVRFRRRPHGRAAAAAVKSASTVI